MQRGLTTSKLTAKQEAFCLEYIKTFNATAAAIASGYSDKTAASIGWENLRKPEIAKKIGELEWTWNSSTHPASSQSTSGTIRRSRRR
ncbi:MAG: terminase small subunit [Chryseobacterium sp.]|nr:MAG: terminase small subunit [Chryseobacterium sp.]